MTEGSINKVLYNVDQRADTTAAEKKTARDNIGAIGADEVPGIADDRYKLLQIPTSVSYAANAVVSRLEQDAQGVVSLHCSYLTTATESGDGLMSAADKLKLDYIQAGAEVNVNADWLAVSGDSAILNKPDLSIYATQTDLDGKQDTLTAGDNITITNNVISATAAPQLNADWDATSGVQEILHKPDLSIYATTSAMETALAGKQDVISDLSTIRSGAQAGSTAVQPATMETALATKQDVISDLSTIRSGAQAGSTAVQPATMETALAGKQDVISDLSTIRSGAELGATAVQPATMETALAGKQDVISDLSTIRSGAELGATAVQPATMETALASKQDVISDLSTIRSGAQAGSTAVQPGDLATVANTGDYDDLVNKPDLSIYAESSDLATVATTGSYNDLVNKPSIPVVPPLKELVAGTGISMVEGTNEVTISTSAVIDANYVHTDNNFTTAEKNKLNGIQAGAEVNVQSDWNQVSSYADDFIRNKPTIPTATSQLTNDSGFITSSDVPEIYSTTTTTPSVDTAISALRIHDNGRVTGDLNNLGLIAPYGGQADEGKVLVHRYSGSPGICWAEWANAPDIPEITWTQDNQGSSVITEADKLDINQDTHRVQMGAGSTTVELGFTVPPMVTAPQEDMFLKMAQGNTVPTWSIAPEGHTVGFMTMSFPDRYDYGQYGYMGIGPMPDRSIILTLTAETGRAFFCGTATYWGICAYNPADKTQYAVFDNPLHEVYHVGYSYMLVADNESAYPNVPKTISVTIPTWGEWHFYGGLRSVAGCALCLITYEGTGGSISKTIGDSPCNSDYASINGTVHLSYEYTTTRYINSIDTYPIFAERSANDASGYNIEQNYLKKADEHVYTAGAGINVATLLPSGEYEFSWAYTVGRNLHVNQDNAIQTKLPGGTLDPSSTSWQDVGEFAGAYRMLARANSDGTYDLGVSYYGQGANSTFTIIGQQIVAEAASTTLTITKCNYINEPVDNLGTRIGPHFDPATMQSLTIEGHAYIGPLSDFRATLWTDGTTVHAAFSAIEVGTVGATN